MEPENFFSSFFPQPYLKGKVCVDVLKIILFVYTVLENKCFALSSPWKFMVKERIKI